jgi:small-conductance mechanosensitive channel
MVFLLVLAVLMALSSLGVQIGPLIASAGVIGIAVGFGAQTLVKDIFSGMFYLLDDAFRVGEYIVAGDYRGTVESFSLRSVRLRHHRGPVFTIPFGQLGAIQNLSRDYVIDKLYMTVTYDSDMNKIRKILKEVGNELAADPELAPLILEPLKLQGIDEFGDYGIVIKVKMVCQPGGQYIVRKKAYLRIKELFDENDVKFAYPTVRIADEVADGSEQNETAAAAKQALAIVANEKK